MEKMLATRYATPWGSLSRGRAWDTPLIVRTPVMHRSARLLLTVALFTITAIILFGAARLVHVEAQDSWTTVEANERLVGRYYTAINGAIATGDTAPLDALLAPDFVEGAPLSGSGPDRSRLDALLIHLHRMRPQFRLVVVEVIASTETTFATVEVDGGARGSYLGVPVEPESGIWGPTDSFTITDARITAHWNHRTEMVLAEPLLDEPLPALQAIEPDVELLRLTLAPGASTRTSLAPGPTIYVAERGTLFVETGRAQSQRNPGEEFDALSAGESVVIPPGSHHMLTSGADQGAVVLIVAMGWQQKLEMRPTSSPSGLERNLPTSACTAPGPCGNGRYYVDILPAAMSPGGLSNLSAGLAAQSLGYSTINAQPVEPVRLALGWLTLGPGANLALPSGSQHIIAVETGELRLDASIGSAVDGPQSVASGLTTVVGDREALELWNHEDEPLRLLVLTFSAEDGAV